MCQAASVDRMETFWVGRLPDPLSSSSTFVLLFTKELLSLTVNFGQGDVLPFIINLAEARLSLVPCQR